MLLVNEKDLVVPGQVLAENDYYPGRGTFKEGKKICSSFVGLVSVRNKKINVIPLQSKYIPKRGDVVIGEITDIRFSMWGLDINSPYSGLLPASEVFGKEKRELENVFDIGDVLLLRVVDVDEVKKVKLGLKGRGLGKFRDGILVYITPTKVPRLIGKRGSMINMVKEKTHCDIVVGQNGVVWIKGEPDMERIAERVILMIDREAHTSGLTDRVRELLDRLTGTEPKDLDEDDGSELAEPEAPVEDAEEMKEETENPDDLEEDEEELSEAEESGHEEVDDENNSEEQR
ncbi:exosome complex RNA-binding protein Rrp4 [Methanothermobacter marburgensis]|uniref:Exosome complex component Rrp4 n=1 Tax=Methanothermobacter marburgensis (strain ATCC BAA-927 / DSM 2133 / JCM 14651 / NBRC 100331 / OCM 82 / Marburg) TaxID=79929 RepID=D9PWR7_METTM|nr:exosome complex RNA-binding protein Rrp4 [Methanothermobacter marburgensis]ADL58665.1 predicted exosome RNA binding protein [Methanothermobacter marburgensis str. Marburg]WBF09241.1 exosome complex protein Rrp4 [Methanothermobacter marburgensis]